MSTKLPAEWKQALEGIGLTSYQKPAESSGLSVKTVRMATLERRQSVQFAPIAGLAFTPCLPDETICEYLSMGQRIIRANTFLAEAFMLTGWERDQVDELIRLLITSRTRLATLRETSPGDASAPKSENNLNENDRDYPTYVDARVAKTERELRTVEQGDSDPSAREHIECKGGRRL